MHNRFTHALLTLGLIILALSCCPVAQAQQQTSRLILKDGSYQSVAKYEIQGDRVHYLSAERYEWEDLPASLVDWEATKKYDAELKSGKLRRLEETPEEKEEREKEEANSPEIAPGLRLPGSGGVFLFDLYQGKPELAEIVQNGSELKKNTSKNVLRSTANPLAGSKQSFEIKGAHAQIQSHQPSPILYVDIDEGVGTSVAAADRFKILRATSKNDSRVIGNLKVSFTGKMSEETSIIPTKAEKVGIGEWVKITPAADLPPGEYALVEILGPQEMNLYVWDFGVNPKAQANPNTWQPTAAKGQGTSKP